MKVAVTDKVFQAKLAKSMKEWDREESAAGGKKLL